MSAHESEPVKLREVAYASFTERLLSRDILPGQFVTQRELVALTGLPLGAIRELVPRLEADGLIKTVPQRGMQVAHIDLGLIRNAFQFRLFLEREAAALYVLSASDVTLAALRERHEAVITKAEARLTEDVIAEAQAVDWSLHDEIIDALDNEIISSAYRVNSIKIRIIRQSQTRLYADLVLPVMREHLGIIDAFETRDPQAAAKAIGDHIVNAKNRALGFSG
ncbi:MAG TPA: GntR family transcriptional regulator [Alphaproteobacteria bacterium]|nr:GntR family transcriptional regulator [Alphaproteobacteria bacterium]